MGYLWNKKNPLLTMISSDILINAIEKFLLETFGVETSKLEIEEYQKLTDFPVESNKITKWKKKWIFYAKFKQDEKSLFIKIHLLEKDQPKPSDQVFRGIETYKTLQLKASIPVHLTGYSVQTIEGKKYEFLAFTKAEGTTISSLLYHMKQNNLIYQRFRLGLQKASKALAEIHAKKLRTEFTFGEYFQNEVFETLTFYKDNLDLLPENLNSLLPKILKLLDISTLEKRNLYFHIGIVHGDAIPDNFCYEEKSNRLTILDFEHLTYSITSNEEPVGPNSIRYCPIWRVFKEENVSVRIFYGGN